MLFRSHAKGWSRDQAIDYMLANSGMGRTDAEAEVDRYVAIPAQALSYKIGSLTIQRLRREAETALGAKFDIRAFHEQVLGSGARRHVGSLQGRSPGGPRGRVCGRRCSALQPWAKPRYLSGLDVFITLPKLVQGFAIASTDPLRRMVRRVHAEALLRKRVDRHEVLVAFDLKFKLTTWVLSNDRCFFGIADKE